ncbi:MAG: hypothetical protein Q4B77_06125 [Coriobacteriaceae bacterium]|nr:hypothetical protein [Coriobacteriaceae bacterium]
MSENEKTVFQIGIDALRTMIHPRKHGQRVDSMVEKTKEPIASARLSINRSLALLGDNNDPLLTSLADTLRFSDPRGTPETVEIERRILNLCHEIEGDAASGSISSELIGRTERQLHIRNLICKESK